MDARSFLAVFSIVMLVIPIPYASASASADITPPNMLVNDCSIAAEHGDTHEFEHGGAPASMTETGRPADIIYTKPSSYSELVSWYHRLEKNYSGYIEVFKANELYGTGKVDGIYDLYYVRITNESLGLKKPEVLFLGSPHGDETAATISMYWFSDWAMRTAFRGEYAGYWTPYVRWMFDNRELYFEVSHNPWGFDAVMRENKTGTDLNREADLDHAGSDPFRSVNGRTLVEFINHHQIRIGCDFHGGIRRLLYPWGSTHENVTATSGISGYTFKYAPPDFNYYDSSCLRLGSFMGNAGGYGGFLTEKEIGTIPVAVGYAPRGGIAPWAYGSDVSSNPAETPYVKNGSYPGAGILWISPEISPIKNPPADQFGSDYTPGYGPDVRRFILHQADLAQPYVRWHSSSVKNGTTWAPGAKVTFKWQVNGSMVVDHTNIVWGKDPNVISKYEHQTPDRNVYAGKLRGGTGWDGAKDGKLTNAVIYEETITLPTAPGDYYFAARAQVDQIYNKTIGEAEYGKNTYLRLIKERCWDGWKETINGTDSIEEMKSSRWWYSPIYKLTVDPSIYPFLEISIDNPKGGETWFAGKTYLINYTLFNGTPDYNIDIHLSTDNGYSWDHTIAADIIKNSNGAHSYSWTIPITMGNCSTCKIKAQVQDSITDVGTYTTKTFKIVNMGGYSGVPVVTVKKPSAGELWYINGTYNITWSILNGTPPYAINIFMSDDGGMTFPYVVSTNIPQDSAGNGTYAWKITHAYPQSDTCRIWVQVVDNYMQVGYSISLGTFRILKKTEPQPPPEPVFEVRLQSPNGGESYVGGSTCSIRWSTSNGTKPISVSLYYSIHSADGVFAAIAYGIENTGIHAWRVPEFASDRCIVKITAHDFRGNVSSDLSDGEFKIWVAADPVTTGNLTGRVADAKTGAPLKDVLVNLYVSGKTDITSSTRTNQDGVYLFSGVKEGTYDIQFIMASYREAWHQKVNITAGTISVRDMNMEKASAEQPKPAVSMTKDTGLPMNLTYESLVFLVAFIATGIAALIILINSSRQRKKREELKKTAFVPIMMPTDRLQEHLMREEPKRPPGRGLR